MLLLLALAGCTWVSKAELEERLGGVDDDGDGAPVTSDCDDADATIHPGATEAWYDGIDADCGGDDDYDQDGDGFVPPGYEGLSTWGVVGSGALDGGDCDDAVAEVHPGAADTAYDGVDTDCGGEDDFDQDGDRYVPTEYAGTPTTYVPKSGVLPGGDCDDTREDVNPVAPDEWYDGVDADCAGDDDHDQDGDGYVPDAYVGLPTTGVDGSGALPGGDCDDTEPFAFPGGPDEPYDGLDGDCADDDDFDRDGDGWVRDADVGRVTEGVPGTGALPGGDCDDGRADVRPDAIERLGDTTDQDCDGSDDRFRLDLDLGCTFTDARAPAFLDDGVGLALSVLSTRADCSSTWYEGATLLMLAAGEGVTAAEGLPGSTSPPTDFVLGDAQAVAADGAAAWVALPYATRGGVGTALVRYGWDDGATAAVLAQSDVAAGTLDDLSLSLDSSGRAHVLGCAEASGVVTYTRVDDVDSVSAAVNVAATGYAASRCAFEAEASDGAPFAFLGFADGLRRYTWSTDGASLGLADTGALYTSAVGDVDWDGGGTLYFADLAAGTGKALAIADGTVTRLDGGLGPDTLDIAAGHGLYWYALVDADGYVRLGYGTRLTALAFVTLEPGFIAEDVAVVSRDGYTFVAVTGGGNVAMGMVAAP